ncbi:MAG: HAMP domain-containing histidine kinase [Oscillospiraceae bacterium]|nr:HAMP domain-containing histidine kinase [Oscillospiraceae bacterium]
MKKNEFNERYSLTLLYSFIVFFILLISVIVSIGLAVLLSHLGLLAFNPMDGETGFSPLIFMALVSLAVGLLLTFLTRKVPLSPINTLVDSMNKLKSGDYKTRLYFKGRIRKHPVAVEIENSFNTMAQELENTEILRSDFINNFSHEFKTPIVSIAGFAKLLRRGNLTEEQKQEYLGIIEEESLRLSAMATNVLNLSKIENQTILTDINRFNLSEQIRACVLLLEDQWMKKSLSLDLDFDEHYICANEELLKQVWINLIDNAIKFSPITGELSLGIEANEKFCTVSITNYGEDIHADKLDKIWNKFYQADESHSGNGNGIGLAIVKAIVELHHGSAEVESSQGKTTFKVTLPSAH